uniref:non-specific serine/threonine protein kinase n=1 Tax=Globodera pallida TaxID=36090 RepID=A0A183CK29_GLOPA
MSNSTESTNGDTTADQCNTLNKNDENLPPTFAVSLDPSAEEMRLLRLARIADLASISTESTNGDITADQEHLRLTFAAANLDQSEEVRRARIAQLREEVNELKLRRAARNAKFECAKDIAQLKEEVNAIKGQQKATADHFGRLDATVRDLQSKAAAEQEHQKLADADATLQNNVVKLEEDQNKQQQNIAALTDGQQKLHTTISELEHAQKNDREEIGQKMDALLKSVEKLVNADATLQNKVIRLEEDQNKQQRNIDKLQKSITALAVGHQKLHTTIGHLEHAQTNDREEMGQKMDALLKSVKEHQQKLVNADASLQNKFVKLEEEQKKQQRNIEELHKSVADLTVGQQQNRRARNPSPSQPPPLRPLSSVYDFKDVRGIGTSAFAGIFHGREMVSRVPPSYRDVALKRFNLTEMDMDSALYQSIVNEINIFKLLNHPNIVKCFYSFEELSRFSGVKYRILVLEYVNGGDLEKWLKRKTNDHRLLVPEADIWRVFSQIADAVCHMHARHIIHRDLKPSNVLLNMEDSVKLTDFVLSRQLLDDNSRLQTVRLPGYCTRYYMSPERILDEPCTKKSDIWSLGCILYEMATLRSPFFGAKDNSSSLMQKIRVAEYPPLPDRCCYTGQLELLVELCLNPVCKARPSAFDVHRMATAMAGHWRGVGGGGGATTSK